MNWKIHTGDCLDVLRTMPDASVHCCVTSPPYWGLRDYGVDGQLGLERTPEEYVSRMVDVFREVRRVLLDDGTLWLNLGDSYSMTTRGKGGDGLQNKNVGTHHDRKWHIGPGLKPKDLVGIPWRVAFALQVDGWYLRQDIIWHKPNPMPESVRDRCTKAHEYVFLLSKRERYFYDAEAVKEPASTKPHAPGWSKTGNESGRRDRTNGNEAITRVWGSGDTRNRRSVWTITPKPFKGAHFAVMPPDLVEPCVKAGCPVGGTVLDPFNGAGTTGVVAVGLGRNYVGIELNPEYVRIAEARIQNATKENG